MRPRNDTVGRVRTAAVAAVIAVLGTTAVVGALVWGFNQSWNQPTVGTISGQRFDGIALGTRRPNALHRLGRPQQTAAGGDILPYPESRLGSVLAGTSCDFYEEQNALMDPGMMRLCYRNSDETLVEKAALDMGTSVNGGTAASTLCVWTAATPVPACR